MHLIHNHQNVNLLRYHLYSPVNQLNLNILPKDKLFAEEYVE
jgi:hypothetical protein